MSEPIVEVRGLSKQFKGVLAVDDLSFHVEQGQVCGLLGPNGAGKTTSLRVLLGLIHPTAGDTRLFGETGRPGSPLLRRVGALIETAAFVPHLSGMTNLKLWWEAGGAKFADADLESALAIAGLGDAIDRKVKTYSQGMRQRLGLARVLLGRPEVLVLDEPTNGLDPGEMREVRQLVHRVADAGATVLFSSHMLAEVEQTCSHAVVMDKGKLVASGSVAELIGVVGLGVPRGRRRRPRHSECSTRCPTVDAGRRGTARAHGGHGRRSACGPRRRARAGGRRRGDGHLAAPARGRLPRAGRGRRVVGVVRTESVKATRRLRTYISFGVVVVIPIIMTIALKAQSARRRGSAAGAAGCSSSRRSSPGLVMPAAALALMSAFLLIIIVAIFGGDAMASDASWGNLRFVLMRPVGQGAVARGEAPRRGVAVVGGGAHRRARRARRRRDRVRLASARRAALRERPAHGDPPVDRRSARSTSGSPPRTCRGCSPGSWRSRSCSRASPTRPPAATVTGVGLYITSQILDAIEPLGSLRYVLPTHYFDSWRDLIFQGHATSDMARGALLMVGYVLLFTGLSVWWFRRKDILS